MKSVFLSLLVLCSISTVAQQEPTFVSEGFTPLWSNPASFGSWNKLSVNAMASAKNVGLDGAPRSFMLNAEFDVVWGAKGGKREFNMPIGFIFNADNVGFSNYISVGVPINFQFKLSNSRLAIGLTPGYKSLKFSSDWVPPQTIIDPLLPVQSPKCDFNLDAGIFWYSEKAYAGLSMTQLNRPDLGFSTAIHYHLNGGYRFSIGQHYIFPQLQIKFDGATAAFWNLNYFQFKEDLFSIGIGVGGGMDLLLAATARYKQFKLAYNYDYVTGPLAEYTKGSHQIRLSFIVDKAGKNKL